MNIAGKWAVRSNQIKTIVRMELKRNFLNWRGFWVYILALGPAVIIGAHSVHEMFRRGGSHPLDMDTTIMAGIFQVYYLRLGIFFGCMGIFTRLWRGEMVERSLHYYLLAPVRRELLAAGKFAAGAIAASAIFSASLLLSFPLMYLHYGAEGRAFILKGPGLGHLTSYLGVTVLACVGYGALFLLMGLLIRNPILPAVVILLWESMNHMLPSSLKKLSIIFYLEPLCPVELPAKGDLSGLFALPADAISGWVAVPGLLIVATLALLYTCIRVRHAEINYTTD